jgi:hypothetical protein
MLLHSIHAVLMKGYAEAALIALEIFLFLSTFYTIQLIVLGLSWLSFEGEHAAEGNRFLEHNRRFH